MKALYIYIDMDNVLVNFVLGLNQVDREVQDDFGGVTSFL